MEHLAGVRDTTAWHGTLSEMGMVRIPVALAVGEIDHPLNAKANPIGDGGGAFDIAFPRFTDDLA